MQGWLVPILVIAFGAIALLLDERFEPQIEADQLPVGITGSMQQEVPRSRQETVLATIPFRHKKLAGSFREQRARARNPEAKPC